MHQWPHSRSLEAVQPRIRVALLEFGLMASLFGLYYVTQGIAAGRAYDAFQNAFLVMRIEQALGLNIEQAVQAFVLANPIVTTGLNAIYTYTHLWTVVLFGVWAFFFVPGRYREVRATFLAILGVGLLSYTLFPLAPPRFFPWRGFVDTLALSRGSTMTILVLQPFITPSPPCQVCTSPSRSSSVSGCSGSHRVGSCAYWGSDMRC